jgi:hypothetical protein
VKDQITEDVELMRALKGKKFRVRLYLGQHLAATRMHSNLGQMFNGWARIYSGTPRRRPWRILQAMWFTLIGVFTVYPALVYGLLIRSSEWTSASLFHLTLMTLYLGLVYYWSGNRPRYALLAPVTAGLMLGIFGYSLRKCQTGRIVWRDTHFAAQRRCTSGFWLSSARRRLAAVQKRGSASRNFTTAVVEIPSMAPTSAGLPPIALSRSRISPAAGA